jgi:glycosyltransferase involved in cell wall biosynthesis
VLKNCRQNLPESATVALHNVAVRLGQPIAKHVSRLIAPSEFTRQWLAEQAGIESGRITTVMPFIRIPDQGVEDPAAGKYIAFSGRFAPEKGIATLIEGARLAGVPLRLSRSADQEGTPLGEGVEEVVTHSRAELDEFYRGAKALVVPSEWFETFGLVGAEAMSHGVPVIASRVGALSNLVDDDENGLFFEMGNPVDLASKLTRIWNDGELCRRLGHAARRKVLDHWTPDIYLDQILKVYEEVIAASGQISKTHASFSRHSNL